MDCDGGGLDGGGSLLDLATPGQFRVHLSRLALGPRVDRGRVEAGRGHPAHAAPILAGAGDGEGHEEAGGVGLVGLNADLHRGGPF